MYYEKKKDAIDTEIAKLHMQKQAIDDEKRRILG